MEKKKEPSMTFNRPPPEKRIGAKDIVTGTPVIIKDIQIPFWSMVTLMIKWAFALIPAGLAIAFLWIFIVQFLAGIGK